MIRKPIITVLGHIDAGKTRFLDRIRGTAVIEKEAGGITQHIGATEVPIEVVNKISGELIKKYGFKISIPGLLFIDTPGHNAFTNLRERGGSIADLVVLVLDINKGIEEQTIEAIEILKNFKVPFIAVANKLDTLFEWNSQPGMAVTESMKKQRQSGMAKLDLKVYEIVGQLHQHGFQSERFDRIENFTKQVPIVPVSAKTGEGFPEVLMFLAGLSQKYLEKELNIEVKGKGKGTILEVKEEKGLGKTVDVILYDGTIKVGDKIALGGKNGVIETKVRALLRPKPLEEMKEAQSKFTNVNEVSAAAGVKIVAPNLTEALSGSPLNVVESKEDIEMLRKEIKEIKIDSDAIGPMVKADTLGSLEALVLMLEKAGLKVSHADVGDVSRKDLTEIETVHQKDSLKGVVFLFNAKISDELQKELDGKKIQVFKGNVIYALLEDYDKWLSEQKSMEKNKKFESVVYPVEFKLIPNNVFRKSKPAIVGVEILRGKLKNDIELMKKGKKVGKVHAIQVRGENVKEAKRGEQVAISIDNATIGRNIAESDVLYSYIPREHFKILDDLKSEFSEEEKELIQEIKEMEKATA
ncbi:MAG TPA: translation initiation factor IF-2 [archaeon]|nr:translation initiation factor IF-2 [archaeon]